MKHLLTLFVLYSFAFGTTMAQDNISTAKSKAVTSKDALKRVSAKTSSSQKAQAESKTEPVKLVKTKQIRPVIQMTDEYIDNQIAEIQKVIDKNTDSPDFNSSGYQKRIKYLESRRPEP